MLVHNTIGRGTFDRAHSLGRHLAAKGHTVTLFAGASGRSRPRRHRLNGVELIEPFDPLPARARESGLSPFDLANRVRSLRVEKCDLVHCFDHRPTVSLPGLLLGRMRRVPVIFDWADLWGRQGIADERKPLSRFSLGLLDQLLEERVRRRADALTVINTALRDRAQQRFDMPMHMLPVGASSDLIKPFPKDEARRHLGIPLDASVAVHTGLAPYDIRYLAESFVHLAKWRPKALLVTAGRHFPALEEVVGAAGISERVVRLGILDRTELIQAMGCADVLLLPYTNRSVNIYRYPNKLGDYLSAGTSDRHQPHGRPRPPGRTGTGRPGGGGYAGSFRQCHQRIIR